MLSTDFFRALIADDENDQSATPNAFYLLRYVAERRLRRGLLSVIDATNVETRSRTVWVRSARAHDVPALAVVLDLPAAVLVARSRRHRALSSEAIMAQHRSLEESLSRVDDEGFDRVIVLRSEADVDGVGVERVRSAAREPGS